MENMILLDQSELELQGCWPISVQFWSWLLKQWDNWKWQAQLLVSIANSGEREGSALSFHLQAYVRLSIKFLMWVCVWVLNFYFYLKASASSYLIRLQSLRYPSILLQSTAGVIITVGLSLVDVGGWSLTWPGSTAHSTTDHCSGHQRLQLHLSRHHHIRLSFTETN